MKTLRQICAATILSLTLTGSVFAGQIETPGVVTAGGTPISTSIILAVVSLNC